MYLILKKKNQTYIEYVQKSLCESKTPIDGA